MVIFFIIKIEYIYIYKRENACVCMCTALKRKIEYIRHCSHISFSQEKSKQQRNKTIFELTLNHIAFGYIT